MYVLGMYIYVGDYEGKMDEGWQEVDEYSFLLVTLARDVKHYFEKVCVFILASVCM